MLTRNLALPLSLTSFFRLTHRTSADGVSTRHPHRPQLHPCPPFETELVVQHRRGPVTDGDPDCHVTIRDELFGAPGSHTRSPAKEARNARPLSVAGESEEAENSGWRYLLCCRLRL